MFSTMLNNLELIKIVTIVGHGAESVETLGDPIIISFQENNLEQHAVKMAYEHLEDKGTTLVVCVW